MKTAHAGWAAVVAVACVADALGDRTMSDLFRETSRHPVGRPVMIGVWATLTAHLFGLLPPGRDPIHLLFGHAIRFIRIVYGNGLTRKNT